MLLVVIALTVLCDLGLGLRALLDTEERVVSDVAFSSPSAAASIVAARSADGPLEWKIAGTGQNYRDWRIAKLG